MERYSLNHFVRTLSIFLLCVMFTATAFAQQKTIKGTVVDATGEPLIGVNVSVKGTTIGIITDIDGNYTLEVPSKSTIVFSYIGYQTQEIPAGNQSTINVTLKEDTQKLEEVVVVGYGTQKKVTVTGSVASVSGEELKASPTTNLTNGMVGRMPGVIGFQTADEPGGGGTTIRIRGTNSLGSNDPLVVIDGVPDRDGGMNRLNPTEIESISVLKDASAAIYGARAANGVVLITTKRGKEGKPVVSFNASAGFSQPTRLPKMTNSYEYATMLNEVLPGSFSDEQLEGFRTHANPWKYPDTNWFDEIVKTASPMYRADIGVSGGTEKVKYYANFGANGEDGLYRNSANRYDQYSLRTNLDVKTSKYVDFQLGITARLEDTKYPAKSAGDIFGAARRSRPDQVAWWPSGEPGPAVERGDNPAVTSTDLAGFDHQKNQYIQNNLSVNVKVPWIEGLTLRGNGSYDIHFKNRRWMKKPVYLYTWDGTNEGSEGLSASKQWLDTPQLERLHSEQLGWMLNGLIDYNRTFGQHTIGVTFGMEGQKKQYEETWGFRQGFISDTKPELNLGGEEGQSAKGYSWKETRLNYFGRASYNYQERYLFEFVWRVDGSYRFPKESRYGFFPGVSLAWRASEESFIKENAPVISNLKLRISAGKLGNQNIGDFAYAPTIALGGASANYILGNNLVTGSVQTSISNPELTWEKANQLDLGIDFGLFNNRIAGTIEAYYKRTTDLLWEVPLPLESGFGTSLTNIGKIDNKGIEFTLNTVNISTKDFLWTTAFMISYNNNKIKELYDGKQDVNKTLFVGRPIGQFYLLKSEGIWQTNEAAEAAKYNAQPGDRKILDAKKDYVINGEDRDFCGVSTPKYYGSFTNTFSYKGIDLTAFFTFAGGHKINNSLNRYLNSFNVWGNMSENYYKYYWRQDRPNNKYPAPRVGSAYANGDGTDANLQKGDYLRLRNLEIGYSLPKNVIRNIKASNIRVYFSVQNLFTATEFTGFDVESSDNTNPYPNARSFIGGISLNF